MPSPKAQPPVEQEPLPQPLYPVIESFVERASRDEVGSYFADLKSGLANLKGPKAEQSKKIQVAIAATEELLQHLLEVREKLEAQSKSPSRRK